ncbi:MAG: peptidylprolyl isomerase [Bdellovibrionaceae bacterium]|nr:peptidylprolyl isomerase [Pseudobdellovibrionaceae bacterium]
MASFSHILVQHEYEAQDVLRLLNQGKSFAELAVRFSKCPSAPKGGDLGEMKKGRADEDFEDAAYLLAPGQMTTKPVKTKFGYHLILRNS